MNKLKLKITESILVVNKYIILILSEKKENPSNLKHLFDRKVFLTNLSSKIKAGSGENGCAELYPELEEKISAILESDELITSLLTERKKNIGDQISALTKIASAIKTHGKSYGSN